MENLNLNQLEEVNGGGLSPEETKAALMTAGMFGAGGFVVGLGVVGVIYLVTRD